MYLILFYQFNVLQCDTCNRLEWAPSISFSLRLQEKSRCMIWKWRKRLKYECILVPGERNLRGFLIELLHKAENKKNYVAHGTMLFKITVFAGRLPSPAHDSD